MLNSDFSLQKGLINFKKDILKSKKYWLICLILIVIAFFAMMKMENYAHPKLEIAVLVISCILSIFSISFYQSHNDDKNFYKTVFIIIFIFGIVFSVLTPIMCTHDETEHFVRAEMTSNGIIHPEFHETTFYLSNIKYNGYYLTIQTTFDLVEKGTWDTYYFMDINKSSILDTDADTQPINYTPAKFHSAFAQNPFFAYIAPAIGMVIAKLLNLNAIWLLWLGRIFNSLLYSLLASYAIKKTPILKIPLFAIACIPATLSQAASVGIDPLINGLALISIALFLNYYKSPKNSIDRKSIIKFSIIILLLSLCKATYFCLIFLLLCIPRDNFKEKNSIYHILLIIIVSAGILALWSKFIIRPSLYASWRYDHAHTREQLEYMANHIGESIISVFSILYSNLNWDLGCQSYFTENYTSLYILFTGIIYLFYPHEKINLKTRIGTLIVFCMIYFGTYLLFIVTWSTPGVLLPLGIQSRYFFPALGLLPIFLGFNNMQGDKTEIDYYILVLTIAFIVFRILNIAISCY